MNFITVFSIFVLVSALGFGVFTWLYLKKGKDEIKKGKDELKKVREDYQKEEKEAIEHLTGEIKEIDKDISEKYEELYARNSVIFDCPCNHNKIRAFIDLSKEENTFVCPECKNEYKVDIRMVPILKGRIIDEHNMYNLLSKTMQKEESKL